MRRQLIVPLGFLVMGIYKVVLEWVALIADQVFDAAITGVPSMTDAWIGTLAYTFQIYFDFSAYSDMAVALLCCWGSNSP